MQVARAREIIASPLNFTGGKYKLLPQILPLFPKRIETFVDLFCGGCNVAVNVRAKKIVCNDNDKNLIGLLSFFQKKEYEEIVPQIKKVIKEFNLSDSTEKGYAYYKCNSSQGLGAFNRTPFGLLKGHFNGLEKRDDYYFTVLYLLIVYAFNNQIRFNSKGQFNLPVGKRDFNTKMQDKLSDFLGALKALDIKFYSKDFSNIRTSTLGKRDFVYADPPYLITCATYNENGWDESCEKRLLKYLDTLNEQKVPFALSNVLSTDNKSNTILQKWLESNQQYTCHHLNFSYKNSSYHKKNVASTDEVLITNY